jgi:hypothetical protein
MGLIGARMTLYKGKDEDFVGLVVVFAIQRSGVRISFAPLESIAETRLR